MFRPVRAVNAFEETVERLLQAIRLGVVAPGDRLPAERDLASRLSVSRETLREALAVVAQAGYVQARRGRYGGTFVLPPPPRPNGPDLLEVAARAAKGLADALVLRRVVEAGAAEAAAGSVLSEAARGHLTERLAETGGAELTDYRRMDSRLHLAFAEVTGSPSLTAAVAEARMRVNELLDAIPLIARNIEHSDAQHRGIVAAVLAHQPDQARALMSEHLDGTAMLLRGFLT
ncbi:MAG: FadR family transcriptional regulator [Acidothermales bacterium]|nr:FadR family transcriptional regulator [Acidothermales bacterium]